MAHPKRNIFAMLGWLVWKLLSLFGLKFAKDKLKNDKRGRGSSRR